MSTLWHEGEVEMQRRAGVGGQVDAMGGRMVREQMADPFRRFFGSLPFVVAAAIDRDSDVGATLLAGQPGFMKGGWPGFLRQDPDGGLTMPDFSGNLFFNTLANLLVKPRCGLVFADFETGDMLQLVGDATVPEADPDLCAFPVAERLWRCKPRRIVSRRGAFTVRAGTDPSAAR